MKIISEAFWSCGKKMSNQDSLLLEQALTSKGRMVLAVVSDGIGSLAQGEVASGYIVERLSENFYESLIPLTAKGKGKGVLKRSLLRCFWDMNQELIQYASAKNIRLGATVSLLMIWKRRYLILHLGDSRIYLCSRGRLRQLTPDHVRNFRHNDGSTDRCIQGVTKCMGSFPFQFPDIRFGRLWGKKGFLLCTDGYFRTLNKTAAAGIFAPEDITSQEQIRRRLKEMGTAAVKKGEKDNLSALYVWAG